MGHLLKIKYAPGTLEKLIVRILASKSVPFMLTTVLMPNLALICDESAQCGDRKRDETRRKMQYEGDGNQLTG